MSEHGKAVLGSLEDIVDAFESAMAVQGRARLHDFLPNRSDPDYLSVLQELVRVDMELRNSAATASSLEDYRHDFPELFECPAILKPLAYEEFRLRQRAQQPADARNRSLPERSAKWIRRHPKITSASGILTLSTVAIVCLLVMGLNLNERFRRSKAIQSFLQFQADDAAKISGGLSDPSATLPK